MAALRVLLRELPRASVAMTGWTALCVLLVPALRAAMAVLTGAVITAVPPAIEGGFDSSAGRSLALRLTLLGAAYAGSHLGSSVQTGLATALMLRVDRSLRRRVLHAVTRTPGIAHLEDPRLLDLVDRGRRVGPGQQTPGMAAMALPELGDRYLTALGGFVILLTFSWWVPVVLSVTLVLNRFVLGRYITSLVDVYFGQTHEMRRAQYLADLALNPAAAKELRLFGLGRWLGDRFTGTWLAGIEPVRTRRARSRRRLWAPLTLQTAAEVLFYVALARAVIDGDISIGALGMHFAAFGMLGALGGMSNADFNLALGGAAITAVGELEAVTAEMRAAMNATGAVDGLPRSSVRFEGVGFRYPGTDLDVVRDLDLELPAGRSTAIVGSNGAGKTTLVKLLARLYDPTAGRVTIDGTDLRDLDVEQWQRRIGAIFQDFTRYELTVTENIGFGAPHLIDDRGALESAAERAGVLELIESLPAGWDTILSRQVEGGTDLSGGEWQRIALARALLAVDGGAGVLVLDEPTANLDARAEADLYDRFLSLTRGVTTLVISHRFSTVRRADRIVVVRDGHVVEQGSHHELVELGGRYARMFRLQAARFANA